MSQSNDEIAFNALQAGNATPEHQAYVANRFTTVFQENTALTSQVAELRGNLDRARISMPNY